MPDHLTHFDDCGCLTARYEATLAAYRKVVEEAKKTARECGYCGRVGFETPREVGVGPCPECTPFVEALAALPREVT